MRRLRVVGLGDDDETVILEDPIRHERFSVPGDERLRAAARGDVRRLGQMELETVSPLRPRDIQARVRAGETVEQLAADSGVTEAHIERFAYPVLLERARVADLGTRAHPPQGDGTDPRTLREIVTATLSARGQNPDDARWDAWKGESAEWVVGIAWRAGRSDNTASWTFRPGPSGGVVTARDDPARELLGETVAGPRRVGNGDGAAERADAPEEPAPTAESDDDTGTAETASVDATDQEPEEDAGRPMTATGEVAPRMERRRGSGGGSGGGGSTGAQSTGSGSGTGGGTARGARAERAAGGATRSARGSRGVPDQRGRRHPIVPSWEDVLLGTRSPRE